jgi:hypothetical protein
MTRAKYPSTVMQAERMLDEVRRNAMTTKPPAPVEAASMTDREIDAYRYELMKVCYLRDAELLEKLCAQAKAKRGEPDTGKCCGHEWYLGACVHCNKPAPDYSVYSPMEPT